MIFETSGSHRTRGQFACNGTLPGSVQASGACAAHWYRHQGTGGKTMLGKTCWAALTALLVIIQSPAQTTDGLITGTVTDPSGAAIAGAEVAVTNEGTGAVRSTLSGNDGIYLVPQL